MNYIKRLSRLKESLQKEKIDAFLVFSHYNWFYLTGFSGSEGLLIVTRSKTYLLVDFRYREQAELESCGCEIVEVKPPEMYERAGRLLSAAARVGFEDSVSYSVFKGLSDKLMGREFVPFSSVIENMRKVKDEDEIALIEKVCNLTDRAASYIRKFVKPGMSEREVAAELEYFGKKNGADGTSFSSIVLTGKHASSPHGIPSDRKLREGELLLIDFGFRMGGYCSDMTRMVSVGELPSSLKSTYNLLRDIQQRAIDMVEVGMESGYIDQMVREWFGDYSKYFGHSLGHGVGIQIHELPYLSKSKSEKLLPGMVFTIEPGLYKSGEFGMRIEDMIVLTDSGKKSLYADSKEI